MTIDQSRRTFIKIAAGTGVGLIIGVEFPFALAEAATPPFAPNPFVRVAPDNTVTVLIKHLDKGQGIATGLSTLVAEELDEEVVVAEPFAALVERDEEEVGTLDLGEHSR